MSGILLSGALDVGNSPLGRDRLGMRRQRDRTRSLRGCGVRSRDRLRHHHRHQRSKSRCRSDLHRPGGRKIRAFLAPVGPGQRMRVRVMWSTPTTISSAPLASNSYTRKADESFETARGSRWGERTQRARLPDMTSNTGIRFWIGCILVAVLAVATPACQVGSGMIVTPFPPDLGYVLPERVQSSMWRVATEISHVEELIRTPLDVDDPDLKDRVCRSLERMIVAARQLDTPGRSPPSSRSQRASRGIHRATRAGQACSPSRPPPDYF